MTFRDIEMSLIAGELTPDQREEIGSRLFDLVKLEKLGWAGTYYHGTTPAAEAKILKEGLKAVMGGKGGISQVAKLLGDPEIDKRTKGYVYLSKSKLLAKIYALAARKDIHGLAALKFLWEHQPLIIRGSELALERDPEGPWFAVRTSKNIPPSLINKKAAYNESCGWLDKKAERSLMLDFEIRPLEKRAVTQDWIRKKLHDPNVTIGSEKDLRSMTFEGQRLHPNRPRLTLKEMLASRPYIRSLVGATRDPGSLTSPIVLKRGMSHAPMGDPQDMRIVYAHEKAHRTPIIGRSELLAHLVGGRAAKIKGSMTPEYKQRVMRGMGAIGGSQDAARWSYWLKNIAKRIAGEKV